MTTSRATREPTAGLLGRPPRVALGLSGSRRRPLSLRHGCRSMARPATPHRRRGQALVEFVLVLPMLLLFLAGIFDFGMGLYTQMTIVNAAREGARIATIDPDPSTIPQVVTASVQGAATGLSAGNLTVTATCVPIVSTSCDFNSATDSQQGDAVSITVTYPYSWIMPIYIPFLNARLFQGPLTLSSTVQMILQ